MRCVAAVLLAGIAVYIFWPLRAAPQTSPAVRFIDIADAAGITFKHVSAPDKKYVVESMSGGVALFDYDGDGCLDIYFTNAPTVESSSDPKSARSALYQGHCDGTFTDVTERSGLAYPGWAMGALAADFDGDGRPDLYLTCLGHNHLYHNNGDGTFTDITAKAGVDDERWSMGAALADYDNDGAPDLFVSNYVDFKLNDLPKFGQGVFCMFLGMPVQCGPRGLPGAGDSLFHNNGDGTFTNVTQKAGVSDPDGRYGLSALWTDVDGDGWQDLYVANDAGPNFLYHNKHDGTFEEIAYLAGCAVGEDGMEQGSMGVAAGDYLHTGRLALFVTNFADQYEALYRHDGALQFADVSFASGIARLMGPWVSWGTAFFDYDNDGWLDLLVVNGHVYPQMDNVQTRSKYMQRMLLFHNNGNGTFSEVAAESGETLMIPRSSRGAAFGDIDNDGNIDVVVENMDGKPTILYNQGGTGNHWITIKAAGIGKNPDALGARVKVVSGDLTQWDEVRAGGSYISTSDLRLHYGLGRRERVDLIEVHWPDGKVETVKDVPADNFLTIQYGKGLVKTTPPRKKK